MILTGRYRNDDMATCSAAKGSADLMARKKEAIAAVAAAKRDLLQHSLAMMVKQGLTSAESADGLYKRYADGDALVDAAIEAYAADRDVTEFLDTLHILANNSKEDLDAIMNQANESETSSSSSSAPPPPAAAGEGSITD